MVSPSNGYFIKAPKKVANPILKMNAIKCYSSQFYDPESNESETLISKKNFLNTIYNRSLDLGRLIGVEHAEGFTSNKIIGAKSINDLI